MMLRQQVYPQNPTLARTTNIPRKPGHTRTQAGRLEYKDPIDNTWKPAVRLETIRPRLIEEAPPSLYAFAKEKGYDATDVTTFLAKDQPYGSDRDNRDPILFQIISTGIRGQKPTRYLEDSGLIVLDAFEHGIRDFPLVLPKCLSTNLGGYDITNYFRQNEFITLYDLIARMPNGYHEKNALGKVTWHEGPPRYGTVGMRATRFRMQAGLLSWKRRMGSDAKNAKILSLIPANCKDPRVNSTISHRDFTDTEQDAVRRILVGTAPNRGRNAFGNYKRRNQNEGDGNVEESEATITEVDDFDVDEPHHGLPGFQGQDTRLVHFGDNGNHPHSAGKVHYRKTAPLALFEKDTSGKQTSLSEYGHGRSEVAASTPNDIPGPYPFLRHQPSGAPLPVLGSFENPIQVHEHPDRRGRDKIFQISDDSSDSDKPLVKRRRPALPSPRADSTGAHHSDDMDGPTMVEAGTEPMGSRDVNHDGQMETNGGDMREPDGLEAEANEAQLSSSFNQETHGFSEKPATAIRCVNSTATASTSTSAEHGHEQTNNPVSQPLDSPTRAHANTESTDYSDVAPTTDEDINAIQEALELTRKDFRRKTPFSVPSLEADRHKDESYNAQRLRLQDMYSKVWTGPGAAPQLYSLPAWNGGFANWKIPDQEGLDLYSMY